MSLELPPLPPPALTLQGNDLFNSKQVFDYGALVLETENPTAQFMRRAATYFEEHIEEQIETVARGLGLSMVGVERSLLTDRSILIMFPNGSIIHVGAPKWATSSSSAGVQVTVTRSIRSIDTTVK